MKKLLLIILFIFQGILQAQNLVPNPSFEEYSSCPITSDEFSLVSGWYIYGDSPDYFNTCAKTTVSIPSNYCGYQFAASGIAFAGIVTYVNHIVWPSSQIYREIIGTKLTVNLEKGIKYFVSFKVSTGFIESPGTGIIVNCASNNLGIIFTNTPFITSKPRINNYAQINETSIITDTTNWTRIFGTFISDSIYQYIALGNFYDNKHTDTLILDTSNICYIAYYYVDDVCVSTDSLYSANYSWTGINELNKFSNISIYPNPATDYLNIDIPSLKDDYNIEIIDALGRNLVINKITKSYAKLDITNIAKGLFVIKITLNKQTLFYKFLKL